MKKTLWLVLSVVLVAAFVLSACAPKATPTPTPPPAKPTEAPTQPPAKPTEAPTGPGSRESHPLLLGAGGRGSGCVH